MINKILLMLLIAATACGCAATDETVTVIPAEGIGKIPSRISLYPLLSSELVRIIDDQGSSYRFFSMNKG